MISDEEYKKRNIKSVLENAMIKRKIENLEKENEQLNQIKYNLSEAIEELEKLIKYRHSYHEMEIQIAIINGIKEKWEFVD